MCLVPAGADHVWLRSIRDPELMPKFLDGGKRLNNMKRDL
jgi:hypothetical protein